MTLGFVGRPIAYMKPFLSWRFTTLLPGPPPALSLQPESILACIGHHQGRRRIPAEAAAGGSTGDAVETADGFRSSCCGVLLEQPEPLPMT